MKNNHYTPVTHYTRQQNFDYFRTYQFPYFAFTVRMDISGLHAYCKHRHYSVYLNLCYHFTKAAIAVEDFRVRLLQDQLVNYELLHPRLTVPKPDGTFTFLQVDYDPDIHIYNERGKAAMDFESEKLAGKLDPNPLHNNHIFFTALTGIPFSGLTHAPTNGNLAAEPMVCFGRFETEGDRTYAPVGIQVNHVFLDGAAINRFYALLETVYRDGPEA